MIRAKPKHTRYGITTRLVRRFHGITTGTPVVTRGYGVSVRGPRP